jgi:transposase
MECASPCSYLSSRSSETTLTESRFAKRRLDRGAISFFASRPNGKIFSRAQLLHFTANLKVELIGMEVCGGSHSLGRALREQGHELRLIPARYVNPYVKTNKSDYIDAEAIAEAGEASWHAGTEA